MTYPWNYIQLPEYTWRYMSTTSRDRLFASLDGRPVDRVPIWLLFPYHTTGYYADVRTEPSYREVFELSKEKCVMLDRRSLGSSIFAPSVEVRDIEVEEDGWTVSRREYRYRGMRLYSETRRHGAGTASGSAEGASSVVERKKLLSSEEDLEILAEFPFNTDASLIRRELDADLPRYLAEREEFPEDYGAMMLDLGEPIGFLYHAADLAEYPIWSLTRTREVTKILHALMERSRHRYRYCLERGLAEVYFLVGSELASPPMVSRTTFREWIVPYAKELIEMIHVSGARVIQHYHGQIAEILDDFVEMAPDGLHTIESPPVGNCSLDRAYEVTRNRITLIGNIQYDDFRAMCPDEMREAVRAVIDEAAGRRFILSPSAGPYETAITPTMRANYLAFIEAGWDFGEMSAG